MNKDYRFRSLASPKGIARLAALLSVAILPSCAADAPWSREAKGSGKIDLSLISSEEVESKIPQFRATENPEELTAPNKDDFRITLESVDKTYSKTWNSLSDFNKEPGFTAGRYNLIASYGTPENHGFAGDEKFSPAFEGRIDNITIADGETTPANITATLAHSMIHVEYDDNFAASFSDYQTIVKTEGYGETLTFTKDRSESGFVIPGNLTIDISLTREDGKEATVQTATQFPASPKTKYNLKFSLNEGGGTLTLTFDDGVEQEDVEVELTDEIFTTPKPAVSPTGFADGATINHNDWNTSTGTYAFDMVAYTGIKSAILTIETTDAAGAAWIGDNDLCDSATRSTLAGIGINVIGMKDNTPGTVMKGAKTIANVDVSGMCKKVGSGSYRLTLNMTDNLGRVAKPASVILSSETVTAQINSEASTVDFGSDEATLYVIYNGNDPENDITFRTEDETLCDWTSIEESTYTRGVADKTLMCKVKIPKEKSRTEKLKIYPYVRGVRQAAYEISVTPPTYEVAIDAYAKFIDVKVMPENSADLAAICDLLKFQANGADCSVASRNSTTGIIRISGFEPANKYTLSTRLFDSQSWAGNIAVTTESATNIPNGDFSQTQQTIKIESIQDGGGWGTTSSNRKTMTSISVFEPTKWSSINEETCYSGSDPKNTWYMVPSTMMYNKAVKLRNVDYDHNGEKIGGSTGAATYYSTWTPTTFNGNAAGELFLSEEFSIFESRPSMLIFDYMYTPIGSDSDQGDVIISILDESKKAIGSTQKSISSKTRTTETLYISYEFGKQAKYIQVRFRSSNAADSGKKAPTVKPTGSALKDYGGVSTSPTLDENTYKALSTGSELLIYKVELGYDMPGTAQGAPKRKTTRNAKK